MPLNRMWSYPVNTTTTETGAVVTASVSSTAGAGFNLAADSVSTPTLVTAPANAASVYAPASYTANTASVATVVQNTLGYDAQFTAYFIGSASVATFQVGVGSSATPAPITVATGVNTNASSAVGQASQIGSFPFSAYVPSNYYFSFQVSQANGASVPNAALTIVATPV